jgi:hypothetical protein
VLQRPEAITLLSLGRPLSSFEGVYKRVYVAIPEIRILGRHHPRVSGTKAQCLQ